MTAGRAQEQVAVLVRLLAQHGGALEPATGLLVRQPALGDLGGRHQVEHRLLRVPEDRGFAVVVCEALDATGGRPAALLEGKGHALVVSCALGRWEEVEDRLPRQRVDEPEVGAELGDGLDEPHRDELIQCPQGVLGAHRLLQQVDVDVLPHHCDERHELAQGLRQPGQPSPHRLTHDLGRRQRVQGRRLEPPASVDVTPDLAQEERVAPGAVAQDHGCRSCPVPRHLPLADEVLRDVLGVEWREVDPPHAVQTVEVGHLLEQRLRPVRCRGAVRREDEHA